MVEDEDGVVREGRTPALPARDDTGSTADLPFTHAVDAPDAVVPRRQHNGVRQPVTAAAFAREVTAVAKG